MTQAADLIKNLLVSRAVGDENIVGEKSDVNFFHILRDFDKGEEISGIHWINQIASVEDRPLYFEKFTTLSFGVVLVDHALNFRCFNDRIEGCCLICHLDDFGFNGFSRNRGCWGHCSIV